MAHIDHYTHRQNRHQDKHQHGGDILGWAILGLFIIGIAFAGIVVTGTPAP